MADERELLTGNPPPLVLIVLEDAPQHGYAIARKINRRSDNALRCKQGTIYPALYTFKRDGLPLTSCFGRTKIAAVMEF